MNQEKDDTGEIARRKMATNLDEVDHLKVRLLNRNVDYFNSQMELTQMQALEATRALMNFSAEIAERYALEDMRQVDAGSGKIQREFSRVAQPSGEQPDGK